MSWRVIEADCVTAMKDMDEASVDAVVTDPPYGLEFMGKEWDRLGPDPSHGGNPGFKPSGGKTFRADGRDNVGGRLSRTASSPAPKKIPRCRTCGGRQFGRPVCSCETSKWDSLTRDYAAKMQAWHQAWATEALRVLKPGGHLLAFGGTRTYHRLACAIEDAGFEIRDSLIWLYATGFPKSLDVSKAIDRAAGAEREVVGGAHRKWTGSDWSREKQVNLGYRPDGEPYPKEVDASGAYDVTAPATPEAQRWQGWGTALKPAHEPIVVARKPLVGTVAQNVERFGTGALAIDRCRIGTELVESGREGRTGPGGEWEGGDLRPTENGGEVTGRWPANVTLSHIESQSCPTCEGTGLKSAATGAGDSFPPGLQCEACDGRGMLGCQRVGERRVKSGNHGEAPGGFGAANLYGEGTDIDASGGYADPDGLETVEAWSCAPGCPVAELDRQSGHLRGDWVRSERPDRGPFSTGSLAPEPLEPRLGDSGGASRFFATFQPEEDNRDLGRSAVCAGDRSQADDRGWGPSAAEREEALGGMGTEGVGIGDGGSSEARFRYVAKASRAERNAGLEGFEEAITDDGRQTPISNPYLRGETKRQNVHPTVKPVDLMRWLVRLVTPPDGTCLDPFAGSGTTGIACVLEDFDFIGIEREPDYVAIARARIAWWDTHKDRADEILALSARSEREKAVHVDAGQLGLEIP